MKFKNNIGMAKKKIDLSKIIVYIAIVVAFAIFSIILGDSGFLTVKNQIIIKNSIFRNSLIFQGLPPIKYQNLMYFPLFLPL